MPYTILTGCFSNIFTIKLFLIIQTQTNKIMKHAPTEEIHMHHVVWRQVSSFESNTYYVIVNK